MTKLTAKLLDALNAANTDPGSERTLARALRISQQAARSRAKRLAELGLLKRVTLGVRSGAMLMSTPAGVAASVADLDAKRDAARAAYVAARKLGEAQAEVDMLAKLTHQLDAVERYGS